LRKNFEKYGMIKSTVMKQNKFGKYAFICYEDPNNPENGFKSAASAQLEMDGLPLSDLYTDDDKNRLFV
jgi:hypothetical protein